MLSTKREPSLLWVPKLPLRRCTPGRMARSAVLFVGSTPSTCTKVHNASRRLRISPAGPLGFGHPTLATRFQQAFHLAAKRRHIGTKRRSFQGAVAHPMPPAKHLVRLLEQGITNRLGDPAAASNRFEIPQQMRPAQLTPPHRIPVVRAIAIRGQNTGKALTQELASHLP